MTWTNVSLGDAAEIVSGATPKSSEPHNWDGEVLWATPSDLSVLREKHISRTGRTISTRGLESCSARLLPANSVLFSSRAPIGLVAINTKPMATNQGFKSFIPKEGLNPDYLYWWLRANKQRLQDLGNGATFKEVSKAVVSRVVIPLPPLDEQRRIAAILDKADAIRRKREQALALADDLLKSTFLDMFGDPVTNPKGWPVEELGEWITHSNNGLARRRKTNANEGSIVLRLQDVRANWIDYSDCNRIALDDNERDRFRLQTGDLLFVRVNGNRDYVGRCSVFRGYREPVYHNDHLIRLKLNEKVSSDYLSFLFNLPAGRHLLSNAVKTSAGQYTVSQDGLKKLKIPLPSPPQQKSFLEFAETLSAAREKLTRADVDAKQLFASLSQRAFRGEL